MLGQDVKTVCRWIIGVVSLAIRLAIRVDLSGRGGEISISGTL